MPSDSTVFCRYALKLQPYVDVVVPHVTKARAASAPYLARVMEVGCRLLPALDLPSLSWLRL